MKMHIKHLAQVWHKNDMQVRPSEPNPKYQDGARSTSARASVEGGEKQT